MRRRYPRGRGRFSICGPPEDPAYQLFPLLPGGVSAVTCDWCDGLFRQTTGKQRFCSAKCRYRARDRKRHRPKGTELTATCRRCGSEFVYVATTKPRLYCFVCSPATGTASGEAV